VSKVRITPIGTCRIHTPLKRASGRYPIEVDIRRNYGFVHTSDEALQLVRFLQGEKQFQPEVAPLVARDGDLAKHEREHWAPSDLHIVEISSAKKIVSGADSVQSNYLSHHFADFFASAKRARTFWALVKKGHRHNLIDFLHGEETFRLLSREDRELLANLRTEPQSFKSIKSDMAEIAERLGSDKLLFVTHVNAATADGELIAMRDRLIRWVKMAADQLGVPVFDPTPAMRDFGQEQAMESGGLDLTHYTPAFYDRVYEEIHRAHVLPLMGVGAGRDGVDAQPEGQSAPVAARLETMLEGGDFLAASREIHAAVGIDPGNLALVGLRGLVRSRIGDFAGAVEDLTKCDDRALSQGMRIALVEALQATGDHRRALAVAEGLLADEHETADLYRAAADAAEQLGQMEEAIAYSKQAFRKDRRDLAAALHALMLLSDHRPPAEVAAWRHEILENVSSTANGAFEVAMWAIRHRDDELFAATVKVVAQADKPGTVDLLEDALEAGLYLGVAASAVTASELGRMSRSLAARRLEVIRGVLDKAGELMEEGRTSDAFAIAQDLVRLADVASSQIPGARIASQANRLIRQLSQQVRVAIREAYRDHDVDEVIRIGNSAGDFLLAIPDGAAVYARSLHDRERTGEALQALKKCRLAHPDSFIATRWTARFAAIAGDYMTALEAYSELRRSSDPQALKLRPEIDRFFATAERRALKQLRQLIVAGEHEDALRLGGLIIEELGARERVEAEFKRLHSLLRRRLLEIEEGDGEGEAEVQDALLRQLVELKPDDPRYLRKLALHLMRGLRFAEAAEVWAGLQSRDPQDETASRQRQRCARMAERRIAAWSGELETAA
jgi:tetratricopeptide (TPR) repeat protein